MNRRFDRRWSTAGSLLLVLAFLSLACGDSEPPTQRVQLASQLLDMGVSEDWELESSTDESRVFVHTRFHNLRLSIAAETENYGSPLQVTHVKSIIGKEMNRRYGGASARITFGGNAVIHLTRSEVDGDGEAVRIEEWVLGKPFGHSHVARVGFILRIPEPSPSDAPQIAELVDRLDKQIGDATIPRA